MDFHSLGDRAQQVASIGAVFRSEHFAGRLGELPQKVGRHKRAKTFNRPLSSVGVLDSGVTLGDEITDSDLQLRIGWTGQARLDRFVEPVQPRFGFGGAFAKIGDVLMPLLDPHASAVDDVGHHLRQPTRFEQSILQMIDDRLVDRVHPHGDVAAPRRPRPCPRGAGIVAIGAILAGPQRHGAAAQAAEADPSEQDRTAGKTASLASRIARGHQQPDRVELFGRYDRRNGRHDVFRRVLGFAGLEHPAVEMVLAFVGLAGERLMHPADPPTAAVARADATVVEMAGA